MYESGTGNIFEGRGKTRSGVAAKAERGHLATKFCLWVAESWV